MNLLFCMTLVAAKLTLTQAHCKLCCCTWHGSCKAHVDSRTCAVWNLMAAAARAACSWKLTQTCITASEVTKAVIWHVAAVLLAFAACVYETVCVNWSLRTLLDSCCCDQKTVKTNLSSRKSCQRRLPLIASWKFQCNKDGATPVYDHDGSCVLCGYCTGYCGNCQCQTPKRQTDFPVPPEKTQMHKFQCLVLTGTARSVCLCLKMLHSLPYSILISTARSVCLSQAYTGHRAQGTGYKQGTGPGVQYNTCNCYLLLLQSNKQQM